MLRRAPLPLADRMDLTPMVGVLLCVFAAFVIAAPILGCGPDFEAPQVSTAWPNLRDRPDSLQVGLTKGGSIYFRGVRLEEGTRELGDRIRQHLASNPESERVVELKADVAARYGEVTRIVEACRKAGVTDIRLVADPSLGPIW